MLIQVLGTGCPKCNKLAAHVEEIAQKEGLDYTFEKITDINRMIEFGIMTPPALIVDGVVKCSGRIPNAEQITEYLKQ